MTTTVNKHNKYNIITSIISFTALKKIILDVYTITHVTCAVLSFDHPQFEGWLITDKSSPLHSLLGLPSHLIVCLTKPVQWTILSIHLAHSFLLLIFQAPFLE